MNKIWLSPPSLSENFEIEFVKETFKSNWITTKGSNIAEFEKSIEVYLNNLKKSVALNSGTSAIHLALMLLGVNKNDEVICQSFTFCATANPILYLGAKPIFVDSEKETWNMNPKFLEIAIKERIAKNKTPKAIIVVDTYGMPAKWDELILIANKYNIPLIEDSAEALGSMYKNKKCGTLGNFGIFSFNGNKIITTSSGGTLLCNSIKEKEEAIHIATQAKSDKQYIHNKMGYNYRMSNVLAGIGRGQMKILQQKIEKRRKINQFYQDYFKDKKGVIVFREANGFFCSNHWLTCILVNKKTTGFSNIDLQEQLHKDNIESRTLWYPLHLQKPFLGSEYYGKEVCVKLYNEGLCLPSGDSLSNHELEIIKKSIDKLFVDN